MVLSMVGVSCGICIFSTLDGTAASGMQNARKGRPTHCVLSQMIDDVEVDDGSELYQEGGEVTGSSKEMLTPRGKKTQRGFDTEIEGELDTTLDSYGTGTSVNDSTMGF